MKGKWIEVKVITSCEGVEPVSGIFYGLDVKGVAIEDPNDINIKQRNPLSWDFADNNIFEYGGKAAVVKAYFNQDDKIDELVSYVQSKLKELDSMGIDIGEGKIFTNAVYEEDWANEWKKYYRPIRLGKKLVIKPIWEEYQPDTDDIIVELDPGMAFGTGTHETTMMCVEYLEKYVKPGDTIYDIGTGSGILAISASKLGAKEVVGVDLDEVAVDSARENVKFNKIDNVLIKHGDLVEVIDGKADIIVANIIADVVIHLTKIIRPFLKKDGIFISSGIIRDRKEDVLNALKSSGFEILEVRETGEWVAVVSK